MPFEITAPTFTLLAEIKNEDMSRDDVALTYALAIRSTASTDWAAVNAAVSRRWGPKGLSYVQEKA